VLIGEMRRYVHEEVPGRAFLIAGHRGAGKTTLVQRVIDDLGDELFQFWWNEAKATGATLERPRLARRPQRPLHVKLHGPSLLVDELPRPGGGENPKPAKLADNDAAAPANDSRAPVESEVTIQGKPAKPDGASDGAAAAAPSTAHGAIVQITIALYRALAREFADAYAIHARSTPGHYDDIDALLEAAAQFRLDLDRAPATELLRAYWDGLGNDGAWSMTPPPTSSSTPSPASAALFAPLQPLTMGIAWPGEIGAHFYFSALPDQGAREIVALATAAQAFQVCSGIVTYQQNVKNQASVERTSERRAGIDAAKDAANRLVALLIGGLLGFGSADPLGLPTVAGVGLGLLGGLAVSASVKRSERQERNEDYTFIVDRSIQTLERDLPLVIERVREAGLAPVFVIDELDKLESANDAAGGNGAPDNTQTSTRKTVGELIRRLKHLTTDFGFFCFLTGPDYFEEVERRIETLAFPEEHTYFSDRLFVLYTPDELDAFLQTVIFSDASPGSPDAITDDLARRVLSRVIIHESRLNTIDVVRAFTHGWDRGIYEVKSGALTTQPRFRLVFTVQLAIEYVLRESKLAARGTRNPRFRQVVVDTLYMISRAWKRGKPEVDLSDAALAKHLLLRDGGDLAEMDDATAIAKLKAKVDENYVPLTNALSQLAGLLVDVSALKSALTKEGRAEGISLISLTSDAALLIAPVDGSKYQFAYDYDGNQVLRPISAAVAAPPPSGVAVQAAERTVSDLIAFAREVVAAMNGFGLTLSNLSEVGILDPISQSEVIAVVGRLSASGDEALTPDGVSSDELVLRALARAFDERGTLIGWAVELLLYIVRDARSLGAPAANDASLRAMARFIDFTSLATEKDRAALDRKVTPHPRTVEPMPAPTGNRASVQNWRGQRIGLTPFQRDYVQMSAEAWNRAYLKIQAFMQGESVPADLTETVAYDDLVYAAAEVMPSRVMRPHPRQLGPLDWSQLAVPASVPLVTTSGQVPYWQVVAGLHAQGFGRELLKRICLEANILQPSTAKTWIEYLAESAPSAGPGVLVLLAADSAPLEQEEPGPYLVLRETMLSEYMLGLKWLRDHNAFRLIIDERTDAETAAPDRA
jgi:hypothetical protein